MDDSHIQITRVKGEIFENVQVKQNTEVNGESLNHWQLHVQKETSQHHIWSVSLVQRWKPSCKASAMALFVALKRFHWRTMKKQTTTMVQFYILNITHPQEELNPLFKECSLWQWGIDLIEPLPKATWLDPYIVVYIDYLYKCIETTTMTTKMSYQIIQFLMEQFISWYGIPKIHIIKKCLQSLGELSIFANKWRLSIAIVVGHAQTNDYYRQWLE